MKFEQQENQFYFLTNTQKYKVQHEDIERLKIRPTTRVLRFLNQKDEMESLPLPTQVGELEGYDEMVASV